MTLLTAEGAHRRALDVLQSGGALSRMGDAKPATALPVADPEGGQYSWMVPLVGAQGSMVGFIEISATGDVLRAAEFGEAQSLEAWTDAATIREHGAGHAEEGEDVGDPVLTYDTVPSRITWAVPITKGGERVATVYVAGASSYRRNAGDATQAGIGGIG